MQQLIEQYQDTVLQAARDIDDAAISVVKTAEQQDLLGQTVRAARRSLEVANSRYREGYADFQRVLDAQRSLFSQAERELVNQGSHVSAVIGLYKALGGGWIDASLPQMVPEDVRRSMQQRSDWGALLSDPLPAGTANPPQAPETSPHEQ